MTVPNIESRQGQDPNPSNPSKDILHHHVTRRGFFKGIAILGGLALLEPTIDKGRLVGGIVQAATRIPDLIPRIEPRESEGNIQDVLADLLVTREWLEEHPRYIQGIADVVDKDGNVIRQYVVDYDKIIGDPLEDRRSWILYETHLDPTTNKFTEYKATAQLDEIENPLSVTCSSDGQTVIIGGEDPYRSGGVKLLISYDGGRSFKDIPWPEEYGLSGGTFDLLRITEDEHSLYVLGNNGAYEGGVGQFIIHINKETQEASIQAAQFIETVQRTNFNIGGANDLQITLIDPFTHTAEMIASGSSLLQKGILLFKDFDYVQGTGTVENITTVEMDGIKNYNLGWLNGGSQYIDAQGHTHFVTSNVDRRLLFDLDLTARTGTKLNYSTLLDNKGIPNYMNGSFVAWTVDVITDAQDNKHTWLGGRYGSTVDYVDRAVLIHLESGTFYDLAPTNHSNLVDQKNMKLKKINGKSIYNLVVQYLGIGAVETNNDGSPILNAPVLYPDKGLGSAWVKSRQWIPVLDNKPDGN